jgi:hypothetical protein
LNDKVTKAQRGGGFFTEGNKANEDVPAPQNQNFNHGWTAEARPANRHGFLNRKERRERGEKIFVDGGAEMAST